MKVSVILGTRPEIIKMSPLIRELEKQGSGFAIVHTGQHYSYNLDRIFFQELELPQPRYNLEVGSGTHAEQTGRMLISLEQVLLEEKPDVVLVEGDTNSVLAGALAAAKLHIKVGHVEAGLRSFDRSMPEELNRILVDHLSDYLFAPTEKAKQILLSEGIPEEKTFVTGNTIVDAVYQNLDIARKKSEIMDKLGLNKGRYFLVTAHRQENVDARDRLEGILAGLKLVHEEFNLPLIYPIHPRTRRRIEEFGLVMPSGLNLIEPVGFLDFLNLEANAALVLTDSGGVQEETCILKVPCVTLRDNTERPETLEVGSNTLVGTNQERIFQGVQLMLAKERNWQNPFGDGKAGERITRLISEGQSAGSMGGITILLSRVLLIDPMTPYGGLPNLGLIYLGSYLDKIGYDVRVVDMNSKKHDAHERLDEALTEFNPEVVGISIMTYFAFSEVQTLLHKLRRQTRSKIVVGGVSPSMFPERMLAENDEIDFLVFGEGEKTFAELLDVVSQHSGGFADILGLAYRDGGRVIVNDKRPLIGDLDSLPMLNFDLVDLVAKYGFLYYSDMYIMATSRGCPYNCSFCLASILCGRNWRPFSAQRVVDEIENGYRRYGLRRISFQDDNFIMQPQRVTEICRLISQRGLNIRLCLDNGIRADRLTEGSLRELCASGLERGNLAVESGSPKVFEMIGKGETLVDVEKTLSMLESTNIDLQVLMVLGLPGDTHETFLESVKFNKKHNVKCQWHLAFPFEGTRMYDWVESNGRFLRNCTGYDIDIISDNDVTTPGTFPLAFDTLEYPASQRIADYYYAVIDSEVFSHIFGAKYNSSILRSWRCLLLVLRYNPPKLPAYLKALISRGVFGTVKMFFKKWLRS